jgi:hypothetical protein
MGRSTKMAFLFDKALGLFNHRVSANHLLRRHAGFKGGTMERLGKIWGVLFLSMLLTVPVATQAEIYVEAYVGGVQGANAPMSPSSTVTVFQQGFFYYTDTFRIPGRLDPAVVGGLKVGTWFVKEGVLGYNYPAWMQYLGFYLDFSYHRLNFRRQEGVMEGGLIFPQTFWSEGTAATLGFMFAARCGFFRDAEVPFGRLQPYVAVGSALFFTSQEPSAEVRAAVPGPPIIIQSVAPGAKSDVALALAVDAGVRWMALKNVSIDIFFKYRFVEPSFHYTYFDGSLGATRPFDLKPTFHLFSGNVGVAYHF